MTMYVVTFDTKDYPKQYVVREWCIDDGTITAKAEPEIVAKTLDGARRAIPADRVHLAPMQGDDPVIVETWL